MKFMGRIRKERSKEEIMVNGILLKSFFEIAGKHFSLIES